MRTYRESAKAWGEAYQARERSVTMGRAIRLASEVFEAVGLAADPTAGLPSQRAILAGAIAEIQEQARAELKAEITAQARALVRAEVDACKRRLDQLAAEVMAGSHFVP